MTWRIETMATRYPSSNRFVRDVPRRVCRRDPLAARCRLTSGGAQAVLLAVLVLLGTVPTGCGKSEVIGKVSGKVTFQGEPVSEGLVLLSNAEKGVHVMAELRGDGTFDVETADGFGLPPGTYQVAITPPRVEFPIDPTEALPVVREYPNIPAKYHDAATSELTIAVEEGQNRLDVDMSP